ncbi:MAG: FkbM family methyltransferase, partial [Burkholderiales bacterium]|nr:FkbM family methyltransferase [Burkholderiales bacterium]
MNECVETFSQNSSDNLLHVNSQNSIAYVIYTSGTTGNPKGVVSQHQGIVNYIYNIKNYIQISSDDKIDFSTNIGFDLTVTTTICGLCLGAQIVIYPDRLEDLELYKEHLIKNDINFIKLVPSYFELLVDALPSTKVSRVILGGEKVNSSITHKLSNLYNTDLSITIYDEYGPTETTVGASHSQIYLKNNSTIGKLYYNYKGYVLDSNLTPLPIGAVGELYIGGVGLARGYLNRPDLTAEKFIANPFQTEYEKADKMCGTNGSNARLYKTGDLVRWLPDGNLEYIGRNDFQVKLRGYRIELGEVEAKLKMYEAVKDAVVLIKNDRLVAYITPNKFRSVPVSNILKIIKNSNTEHKLIDLPNGLEVFYINKQETSLLYDEIFKCNDYVADKINIKDGDTIIDIGANIGMFSISIGIYYQNIKIYAFEPILPIFEVLKKNIEIYELNTECFNYGVGNKNSIEKFTYYPNSSVLSGKYADLEEEKINVKQYLMNQLINETIS